MPTRSTRLFYTSRRHCSHYVHLSHQQTPLLTVCPHIAPADATAHSMSTYRTSRRHCSQYVHLSLSSARSIKFTLNHPICLNPILMLGSRHIALGIKSRLQAVRTGVWMPAETRRYALLPPYPTVLGPIQPPSKLVQGAASPGVKRPGLRVTERHFHSSICHHGVHRHNLVLSVWSYPPGMSWLGAGTDGGVLRKW